MKLLLLQDINIISEPLQPAPQCQDHGEPSDGCHDAAGGNARHENQVDL